MSGSVFISLKCFWGLGIVLSLGSLYYWHSTTTRIPASIPWTGIKDEPFSKLRAWIRETFAGLSTLHEGYLTVSSPIPCQIFLSFFRIFVKQFLFGRRFILPPFRQRLITKPCGENWGWMEYSTTKRANHLSYLTQPAAQT